MEQITIPTRHGDDVTIRTSNTDAQCFLKAGDGAVEIHVHKLNFTRCSTHTAVYVHVESCGETAVATSLSLTHGVARRLAVWLSHNTDRICE
jgi:hypothetical protein